MIPSLLAEQLKLSVNQLNQVLRLLEEGATIPFIARYRKEVTGGVDEVQIGKIKAGHEVFVQLEKRRESILKILGQQKVLTEDLKAKIIQTKDLQTLEDLYLPYKKKRKTKASTAVENGLKPLAIAIQRQKELHLSSLAKRYVRGSITSSDQALQGAREIMAEWISENSRVRAILRREFQRNAVVRATVKKAKIDAHDKYKDYYDFSQALNRIPSHRFLAIQRGVNEGYLRLKIDIEPSLALDKITRVLLQPNTSFECANQLKISIEDAYKRLLLPSIQKEFELLGKQKADQEAILIFRANLRQLLLSPPLGPKKIMAIDPGFRTGCKTVVLNEFGDLIEETVIFISKNQEESEKKIINLLKKHKTKSIAVGNGTAGRETLLFCKKIVKKHDFLNHIEVHSVSEQGASIYSASEVAREEFPHKDLTVRGAVSIGRRLLDPLAELVKIDPKSIGVGQYQHDVNPKLLKESLEAEVISCVNKVGVDLNTASKHLLTHVSGLGPILAENIVQYRTKNGKFHSRAALKKVPRLGEKAFEQAAGFLRIQSGNNPLDNTAVHPESYSIIQQMANDLKIDIKALLNAPSICPKINLKNYVTDQLGLPSLQDILQELNKPSRDPREQLAVFEFGNVTTIKALKTGMVLPGIVTNITAFGCFVDIGVHQDGLVHRSHLSNKFVKNPQEIVHLQQKVKVKIIEVDPIRKRISLSMREVTE